MLLADCPLSLKPSSYPCANAVLSANQHRGPFQAPSQRDMLCSALTAGTFLLFRPKASSWQDKKKYLAFKAKPAFQVPYNARDDSFPRQQGEARRLHSLGDTRTPRLVRRRLPVHRVRQRLAVKRCFPGSRSIVAGAGFNALLARHGRAKPQRIPAQRRHIGASWRDMDAGRRRTFSLPRRSGARRDPIDASMQPASSTAATH